VLPNKRTRKVAAAIWADMTGNEKLVVRFGWLPRRLFQDHDVTEISMEALAAALKERWQAEQDAATRG